jgi:hypothetical protein
MSQSKRDIENKWFKYLSEQKSSSLQPVIEDYFNDKLNFDVLNIKVNELELIPFNVFYKEQMMDDLLSD